MAVSKFLSKDFVGQEGVEWYMQSTENKIKTLANLE
jgi:hypothetical protein